MTRSVRLGGTVGTISEFAPDGAGRMLSLFRDKIDTLTIEYRGSNGALYGAIFTMPVGNAEPLKKDLLAHGAQTTIPVKEESNPRLKVRGVNSEATPGSPSSSTDHNIRIPRDA